MFANDAIEKDIELNDEYWRKASIASFDWLQPLNLRQLQLVLQGENICNQTLWFETNFKAYLKAWERNNEKSSNFQRPAQHWHFN